MDCCVGNVYEELHLHKAGNYYLLVYKFTKNLYITAVSAIA
ncbi:hypothetical protein [Nostoc sp. FACHB-857]|nr:hypothetical protein [Nostoc sp. FACHB-857]